MTPGACRRAPGDALRADLEQARADALAHLGRRLWAARLEHVRAGLAGDVALARRTEPRDRRVSVSGIVAQRVAQLVDRPHVELALDALGVGVQRAGEAAVGHAQLAQRPVERLLAQCGADRVAGELEAVQVGPGEQRVVVEHLLEVGTVHVASTA